MAGGGTELRTSVVTGSARELEWCVRSGSLEIASEAGHDEVERDFPVAVEKVLNRPFPPPFDQATDARCDVTAWRGNHELPQRRTSSAVRLAGVSRSTPPEMPRVTQLS